MHAGEPDIFIQTPIATHGVLIEAGGIFQIAIGKERINTGWQRSSFPIVGKIEKEGRASFG